MPIISQFWRPEAQCWLDLRIRFREIQLFISHKKIFLLNISWFESYLGKQTEGNIKSVKVFLSPVVGLFNFIKMEKSNIRVNIKK